jgi:hypothetical protein
VILVAMSMTLMIVLVNCWYVDMEKDAQKNRTNLAGTIKMLYRGWKVLVEVRRRST